MFPEGDGSYFPRSFHLADDKGDHGEIEPSGRGVEMKGQTRFVLEMKMEFEFIQVNLNGRS